MFAFLETGSHVAIAMFALYAVLAATSLSVKVATRGAASGLLSHQVNAWWRIFPFVSLALLTYPLGLAGLGYLVFILACLELEAFQQGRKVHFWLGAVVVALALTLLGWRYPAFAPPLISCVVAVQALRYAIRAVPTQLVWLLLLITAGAMYIVAVFPALPFGHSQNLAWLFYLFTLTALNDIGQFVSGKLFGKHRIASTISPNKTWQGLAGGIFVSQVVSVVLGTYLSLAGFLTLSCYALLLSIAGLAGDLMFSAAKRRLAIKDFSALIPGHGGILDRVDSLILTAPLLYCLLRTVE